VFILSLVGHHLVFKLAKINAKSIISQQLKSNIVNELVEKIPANAKMQWEEANLEFELSGNLYDVIKKEVIGGQTYYYCINDQKETGLLKFYSNWIQSSNSNDTQKQQAKTVFKYLSIECEMPIPTKQYLPHIIVNKKMHPIAFNFATRTLLVQVPPPKFSA
jgi:hypothetical protein